MSNPTHNIVHENVLEEKGEDGYNKTETTLLGAAWQSQGNAITLKFNKGKLKKKYLADGFIKLLPRKDKPAGDQKAES